MTDVYEFSEFDRKNLIYSFSNMTAEEITDAKERLKKYDEEQTAKKAAIAAAAAAKGAALTTQPPPKPESPVS